MVHNVCSCTVMKVLIKTEGLFNRGPDALTLIQKKTGSRPSLVSVTVTADLPSR